MEAVSRTRQKGYGMNQSKIGTFIADKRREKNMTQAELAEKIGVSNKTISKWENGKCMPDYAVIQSLCEELGITVSELMDGEDASKDSLRAYDEEQILDLLRRTQTLESQRNSLSGVVLIVMGIAFLALSFSMGGSNAKDLMSGLLLGLAIVEMLAGVATAVRGMSRQ